MMLEEVRKIKIAVIDSGVNEEYFKNYSIEKINLLDKEEDGDGNGHGTSTVGEILYYNPDVEIVSIKLLNDKCQCNLNNIIMALDYLYYREDIDIINMSFSCTINNADIIEVYKQKIMGLLLQNKIIVNSISNNYRYTNNFGYPANYLGVCKVRHQYIHNKYEYIQYDSKRKEYVVYMDYRLMPTTNGEYGFYRGNSSAAAKVTGAISKVFPNRMEKEIQTINRAILSIPDIDYTLIHSLYKKYINCNVNSIKTNAYNLLHELELLCDIKFKYEDFVYSDFFTIDNLISKMKRKR